MRHIYFLNVKEKFHDKKDFFNAASKAKDDIYTIVKWMELPIFTMRKNSTPVKFINMLLDAFRYAFLLSRILTIIKEGSYLLVQRRLSYTKTRLLVGALKLKKCSLCLIVHDINSLRFGPNQAEIKALNKAKYLIVHTEAMKKKLNDYGVKTQMIVLEIFDYITDKSIIERRKNSNQVVFAGNLDKTLFLPILRDISSLEFNLYGYHLPEKLSGIKNITYKGKFSPTHVRDIEGSWGLVWDGDSVETCSGLLGEYLRYNAPHKCSLYISSKLPLIVWKESAVAPFIERNGIGICVNSIADINDAIAKVSDEEYEEMQNRLDYLSKKIGNGEQIKTAIRKIQGDAQQNKKDVYNIKIISGKNDQKLLRQTKNGKGLSQSGKYRFFFSEDDVDVDFLFVRNKYIKKDLTCKVAPENTILILSEPKNIVTFPKKYTKQFGKVCSCQEELNHKNVEYGPAILPWFIGTSDQGININPDINYESLSNSPFPKKTKLISVITSNKAFTKGHRERIMFVEKLKEHYGDQIDIFGRGFNDFNDKLDVLAPYKYHIAIENSSSLYYWTEKLSDCYLTGTYPIYYGCKNLDDYFSKDAFTAIDIKDAECAINIIDEIIKKDIYSQKIEALKEAKTLVLNKFNMFEEIASCCDKLNPCLPKEEITLHPAKTIFDINNLYRYSIERNYNKLLYAIHKKMRK